MKTIAPASSSFTGGRAFHTADGRGVGVCRGMYHCQPAPNEQADRASGAGMPTWALGRPV
jgi:hypothetical protein